MRRRQQTLEGQGMDQRIPFDRSDPMVDVAAPQSGGPAPAFEGGPGGGPPGQGLDLAGLMGQGAGQPPGAGFDFGSLGQDPMGSDPGLNTDQLTGADLGAMGGMDQDPEAAQVEQMVAALQDPSTPPEMKQQIEAQIAMAAKRRLGGLGA